MKYSSCLLFLLFICIISFEQNIPQKLDEYLTSANEANKFNGTALIAQNGNVLLHKGYGFKNLETQAINDTATIFQIGSLTKPFTAMVILKLQEEGHISITDKLNKYIADFPNGDKITIQHLLTHTSGIHNYTDDIGEEDSAIISNPVPKDRVMELIKSKPVNFKPGKGFEYCNSGYFLLGMIIEKITGRSYESVVRDLIFKPLHMDHSGFDFKNLPDTNKAHGYIPLNQDNTRSAFIVDSTVYYSAGAIYSSASDLYKWSQAIASGNLLSPASWARAFMPNKYHYGLGFWIDDWQGRKYIKHDGGLLGFMSGYMYFPKEDLTIILLNNTGTYGNSLMPLELGIASIAFGLPYTNWQKEKPLITLTDSLLKTFTGIYTVDGKTNITITLENNQLYAQGNSRQSIPKTPLYPISNNTFLLKEYNATFEFTKDSNNNITGFISHESGKDVVLKKVR